MLQKFKMQQVCQFLNYHIDMDIIELRFDKKRILTIDRPGSTPVMAGVDNLLNFQQNPGKTAEFNRPSLSSCNKACLVSGFNLKVCADNPRQLYNVI